MTLAHFTAPGLIVPQLKGRDAASVLQELCQALQREGRIPDLLPFYQTALNREFIASTGVDAGLAFPHARLPQLRELWFAVGRSAEPVPWGGGGPSVRLVFLSAIPLDASAEYLSLISGLSRLSREAGLRQRLLEAPEIRGILEVLDRIPLKTCRTPGGATATAS